MSTKRVFDFLHELISELSAPMSFAFKSMGATAQDDGKCVYDAGGHPPLARNPEPHLAVSYLAFDPNVRQSARKWTLPCLAERRLACSAQGRDGIVARRPFYEGRHQSPPSSLLT